MQPKTVTTPTKLSKSPLVYVLAQVRIGAILQMAEYVPPIQERLRKAGYPLYREREIREVRLAGEKVELNPARRWHFDAMDRTSGFLLQADAIFFHTTAYETRDAFFACLQEGLTIIHEAVDISLVERLGLRYIDAFQATDGHDLSEYLESGLRGVSLEGMGVSPLQFYINLIAATEIGGKLIIRLSRNTEGRFLPPDLEPPELALKRAFAPHREIAILDYDHFVEKIASFAATDIIRQFRALHTVTSAAFRCTVSEFALTAWQ